LIQARLCAPGLADPVQHDAYLRCMSLQEVTHHVGSGDRAALRQTSKHWMSAISAGVSCARLDLSCSSGYWDNVQQRLLLAFPQVTELLLRGGAQAKVGPGVLLSLPAAAGSCPHDAYASFENRCMHLTDALYLFLQDAGTKQAQLRRWAAVLHSLTITGGTPLDVWHAPRCWQVLLQPQRPLGTTAALTPALCQLTGLRRLSMDCCLGFPAPHALAGLSSLKVGGACTVY
jgi:hypothetical protein